MQSCTIIDVGSNSIRAMDADGAHAFSNKRLVTTRLAEGLDASGRLGAAQMERSAAAIARFAQEARAAGRRPCAYATSAVRDAKNRADFLAMVARACRLELDVLSGEEEARLARLGAGAEALVDIGGGSCQVTGAGFALSYPIGCVRAAALGGRAAVEARCASLFSLPSLKGLRVAGVGGTLTTLAAFSLGLARYEGARVQGCRLDTAQIEGCVGRLAALGEGRAAHPLLQARHDVILPGAYIALCILRATQAEAFYVSEADGMEGYYLANCLPRP